MNGGTVLRAADLAAADARLKATDALLDTAYPGDDGRPQPVHTVYVPAPLYTPGLTAEWGRRARDQVALHGGTEKLCTALGVPAALVEAVAGRVDRKLAADPIEDLRLDFEDGYGNHPTTEDDDAVRAARTVARAQADGVAPRWIGLRIKSFEAATRVRGIRTLDLFLSTLLAGGGLPDGLVITLPKVSTTAQVAAMAELCTAYERATGLPEGRLRFEVQVETPQLILGADGSVPMAASLAAGRGRVSALHYGTYDYSASIGVSAAHQSLAHPAADFAKNVMQVAAAGTGVHLSDGSTNVLPVGTADEVHAAWRLHHDLVRRSLSRAYYQGWDMHHGHLPTRFVATFGFYREGFAAAAARLAAYLRGGESGVMDEPATARALARFLLRGVDCGAIGADEAGDATGIGAGRLAELARPHRSAAAPPRPSAHTVPEERR